MEDHLPNEKRATDVWEDFYCPEYINHPCPQIDKLPKETFAVDQSQADTSSTLQKLEELISDPVTCDSVPRIRRLLYRYLDGAGDDGYKVKDLPAVMKVLEFLAWKVRVVPDYEIHLDRMLELCTLPPLLERSSESLVSSDIMEQYFTLHGYLVAILPTRQRVLKVHEALRSLLIRTKSTNAATVKLGYCRSAMENSRLPVTIAELLEASFPDMYPNMLEVVFLLVSVSHACCYKMLEAGILNTLLVRMDLPYATQLRCTRPPDIVLTGVEYPDETTALIMNILLSLMKSILPPRTLPDNLRDSLIPAQCAMWGLRYTFKRQIRYGQRRSSSVKIRNEIATFILTGLVALPSWNLVSCGIADDIIFLLVGIELDTANVLSEKVQFGKTNEDLFFQKVLWLIVTQLARLDASIALMVKRKLMGAILQLVNPNVEDFEIGWSAPQFWHLWEYALNALSVVAPKIPTEFIKYNGPLRLLMILEWCGGKNFNTKVAMNCARTICSLVLNGDSFLLDSLREHGITLSLIKLVNRIVDFEKITMQQQRVLTLLLIAAERLVEKQHFYQETYGDQSIRFTMKLLFQCLYQKADEFPVDQRLLLALGAYIWACIVWCPMNLRKFVEFGAVYVILDIIEVSLYPTRCLFLGVLTDMCDNIFCGHYLCTWRGADKKMGLMSLFAMIWREEEIRIGVKAYTDGSLEAEEQPLMGSNQKLQTNSANVLGRISPAINDMIGSVRSKIYSVRKLIERDNENYEMAKEHYRVLLNGLTVEDRITISSMDLYLRLKLSQVWAEIGKYFEEVGTVPLGMDGQAIFLMTQRYQLWGEFIKEKQGRITLAANEVEEILEKDEYARIRDSKLASALDAFDELDYIRRTTDRGYLLEMKEKQRREVNSALSFPPGVDPEHCHRTFQDINVTAVFDQQLSINSEPVSDSNFGHAKCPLVSPCDSCILEEEQSSLETSRASELHDCLFDEKFEENAL